MGFGVLPAHERARLPRRRHLHSQAAYAFTYSFITDREDYVAWSPAYVREYIYEVDLPTAKMFSPPFGGNELPVRCPLIARSFGWPTGNSDGPMTSVVSVTLL